MKRNTLFIIVALFLLPLVVVGQCGSDRLTATDTEGNNYTSLKIGPHCWIQSNVQTQVNGSMIYWSEMHPDTNANLAIYGRLYNWYSAMNVQPGQAPVVGEHGFVQGICPDGWHLPNDAEVDQLVTKPTPTLHDVQYWLIPGTNTTTYTMRPGGYFNTNKGYGENLCGNSFMWTAKSLNESEPVMVWSDCHCDHFLVNTAMPKDGMSVRCVYKIYQGIVTTDSVNEVTNNSATLFATVVFNGYDESYERGFVYGETGNMDQWLVESTGISAEGLFSKGINGLKPLTEYSYQAYLVNEFDTVYGNIMSFTTEEMKVATDSVSAITYKTATLYGTVKDMGGNPSVYVGFKYGENEEDLTLCVAKDDEMTAVGPFNCDIANLASSTKYYYKAFETDGIDTVWGAVLDFSTPVMYVTTDSAATITKKSAILYGAIDNMGGLEHVNVGFKYGKSADELDSLITMSEAMTAVGKFSCDIANLIRNTIYYYKAFEANGADTVWGIVLDFTTRDMAVTTDSATSITKSSAVLNGSVHDMGGISNVNVGFRYGMSEGALDSIVVRSEAVSDTGRFICAIAGLIGNTTYYYQAFEADGNDTVWGIVLNFTTPVLTVTTGGADAISNSQADLYGNVVSIGGYDAVIVGFVYGTSENALDSVVSKTITAEGEYNCSIVNLTPATKYYYKAFETDNIDTIYGDVKDFKTLFFCGDSVADREGNWYKSVQIGNQCWTKENLRIRDVNGYGKVYPSTDEGYDVATYGRLYNWAAVMQNQSGEKVQGLCPENWHVPSDADWKVLEMGYLTGANYDASGFRGTGAGKLTGGNQWEGTGTGTCPSNYDYDERNISLFTALPGGHYVSNFDAMGIDAYFWSATASNSSYAWSRNINRFKEGVSRNKSDKKDGCSVRCVRDESLAVMTDTVLLFTNYKVKLLGTVTNMGGNFSVNVGFEYGTKKNALTSVVMGDELKSAGTYNCEVEDLDLGQTYYFRAVVTSGNDTAYGEIKYFNTLTLEPCVNMPYVKDVDGNIYTTVKIGKQCWLAENLRTSRYADGVEIPQSTSRSTTVAYRYCANIDDVPKYGLSYNWPAIMNGHASSNDVPSGVQGPCPDGWHVPSVAEFNILINYAKKNYSYSAKSLASKSDWSSSMGPYPWIVGNNQSANNESGLNLYPAHSLFYDLWHRQVCLASSTSSTFGQTIIVPTLYIHFMNSQEPAITNGNAFVLDLDYFVRCLRDNLLTVGTDSVSAITKNSAKLHATVDDMGDNPSVKVGFKYGLNVNALTSTVGASDVDTTKPYSCDIDALSPNTIYYYQAFGTVNNDTAWGEVKYFTTLTVNPCSSTPTVSDIDHNVYPTIQMGGQCWMAQNLRTSKYNNGTLIFLGSDISSTKAYRYNSNDEESNDIAYGYLYNWKAVTKGVSQKYPVVGDTIIHGICPVGWHVPSDAEWDTLTTFVKRQNQYVCESCTGTDDAYHTYCISKALTQSAGWNDSGEGCNAGATGTGTNATGFSVVPSGCRFSDGFSDFGSSAYFWSATQKSADSAYYRGLYHINDFVYRDHAYKGNGLSVRCVRDEVATITFVPNCGMGAATTQKVTRGVPTALNANTFAHSVDTNWAFSSWNLAKDGSATKYNDKARVNIDGNVTLYAQWLTYCTGTPNANEGGTNRIENVKMSSSTTRKYKVVQIGNQCWMAENLRTLQYADGTSVTAYCANGNCDNTSTYGCVYTWSTLVRGSSGSESNPSGIQGICPNGWHVPSAPEFEELFNYVNSKAEYRCDGDSSVAKALSSSKGWKDSGTECYAGVAGGNENATGFSALPAGAYMDYFLAKGYEAFRESARFWTATSLDAYSYYYALDNNEYKMYISVIINEFSRLSVRCVRDR